MKLTEMTAFYGFGVLTASVASLTCNRLISIITMSIGVIFIIGGMAFHKFEKCK